MQIFLRANLNARQANFMLIRLGVARHLAPVFSNASPPAHPWKAQLTTKPGDDTALAIAGLRPTPAQSPPLYAVISWPAKKKKGTSYFLGTNSTEGQRIQLIQICGAAPKWHASAVATDESLLVGGDCGCVCLGGKLCVLVWRYVLVQARLPKMDAHADAPRSLCGTFS